MGPKAARPLALLVCVLTAVLPGCGEESKPRVSANLQRQLPTHVAQLASRLCADPSLPRPRAKRDRRVAARQLRALERAYRHDPDALVRATFVLSEGGTKHKDITVTALAKSHLLGFESRMDDMALPDAHKRCLRNGRARLLAIVNPRS